MSQRCQNQTSQTVFEHSRRRSDGFHSTFAPRTAHVKALARSQQAAIGGWLPLGLTSRLILHVRFASSSLHPSMPAELFFPDLGDLSKARLLLPPDRCGIRQAARQSVHYPDVAFGFAHQLLWNGGPLCLQQRTYPSPLGTSALCQKQTAERAIVARAGPLVADSQRSKGIWRKETEKFIVALLYPIVTIAGDCMEAFDVEEEERQGCCKARANLAQSARI
jgi:hypothetical protein